MTNTITTSETRPRRKSCLKKHKDDDTAYPSSLECDQFTTNPLQSQLAIMTNTVLTTSETRPRRKSCLEKDEADATVDPISTTSSLESDQETDEFLCPSIPHRIIARHFPKRSVGFEVEGPLSFSLLETAKEMDEIHVTFQNIEIRNYDITLGDNPSCTYGPPVSLDWHYAKAQNMPLDDYEKARGTRRKSNQMQMNALYRRRMLTKDFTVDEMQMVECETRKIRNGRERTKMLLPFWMLEEAIESGCCFHFGSCLKRLWRAAGESPRE